MIVCQEAKLERTHWGDWSYDIHKRGVDAMYCTRGILLVLFCCPIFTCSAAADITRGCSARWEVREPHLNQVRDFGLFESRGRCRSRVYGNDCRRAARRYAQDCFKSHWRERWNQDVRNGDRKPSDCVGRGDIGVKNYNLTDLKAEIEKVGCRLGLRQPYGISIHGRTTGDTGCSGEIKLSDYWIEESMCRD